MPDLFVTPEEEKKPSVSTPEVAVSPETKAFAKLGVNENHFHPLAQFCENPSHVSIEGKNVTAAIKLFVRRHIVTNVPWILTTIVLFLIPVLIRILVVLTGVVLPDLPSNFITVFLLFYYLIALSYAFINFLDWFYNIIIITNTEIIDIDYSDVIYHDVAATNVNLIEDVNYTQAGFIRGLFNFGDLFVQTAGGKENIEALAIPMPAKIARLVLDFIGKGEND
jgi:membrane protein YdbS with pleckstrin-like domain